jgi:hypothetical protein
MFKYPQTKITKIIVYTQDTAERELRELGFSHAQSKHRRSPVKLQTLHQSGWGRNHIDLFTWSWQTTDARAVAAVSFLQLGVDQILLYFSPSNQSLVHVYMWPLFSILWSSADTQIVVVNERNCTNFVSYWSLIVVMLSRVGIFSIFLFGLGVIGQN